MDLKGGEDTHGEDGVDRKLLWELEWHPCHSTDPVQIRNLFKAKVEESEQRFVRDTLNFFFLTAL